MVRLFSFASASAALLVACSSSPSDPSGAPAADPAPSGSSSPDSPGTPGAPGAPGDTCPVAAATDPLTVATDRGLVKGEEKAGVARFLGVPFAAPPVGALRFKEPQAHACWDGVREASSYAAQCLQRDVTTNAVVGSEDCLYLNVWTP